MIAQDTGAAQLEIDWEGPFAWPLGRKSSLPAWGGVYLWAFPYQAGCIPYMAGQTGRPFVQRFRQHRWCCRNGMYTLFDVDALSQGRRVERWRGFWFRKHHPPERLDEFQRRREELRALADEQMAACQIFVTRMPEDRRLRERLEAAVMAQMYRAPAPICDIPERGMYLAPRWPSEAPISVMSRTTSVLYGIADSFEM